MRRWKLAAVPQGMPKESDFLMEEVTAPECAEDGILVRTAWLSVDPYLRGRITGVKSYIDPIPVGSPMESSCVGRVVESRNPRFAVGDWVSGFWQWQDYAAPHLARVLKLDPEEAPVTTALGILGMPGMTAYFGLTELCAPKHGETVFVSGGAGAVGSAVGQIAKALGCRVVGTAGSAAKVDYLKSLGFDAAFDYHTNNGYNQLLDEHCPDGIDCYFDNVGGALTDDVLKRMNFFGRIAVCGQISQYNDNSQDTGPRPFTQILVRQLRIEGFIVSRWMDRFPEGRQQMSKWLKEGKLKYDETIYEGLESAPAAFMGLFRGENTGKAIVKVEAL
jgi:NADPH-dependent curcumin reductase CurA